MPSGAVLPTLGMPSKDIIPSGDAREETFAVLLLHSQMSRNLEIKIYRYSLL
jgi:hypothetical protein